MGVVARYPLVCKTLLKLAVKNGISQQCQARYPLLFCKVLDQGLVLRELFRKIMCATQGHVLVIEARGDGFAEQAVRPVSEAGCLPGGTFDGQAKPVPCVQVRSEGEVAQAVGWVEQVIVDGIPGMEEVQDIGAVQVPVSDRAIVGQHIVDRCQRQARPGIGHDHRPVIRLEDTAVPAALDMGLQAELEDQGFFIGHFVFEPPRRQADDGAHAAARAPLYDLRLRLLKPHTTSLTNVLR